MLSGRSAPIQVQNACVSSVMTVCHFSHINQRIIGHFLAQLQSVIDFSYGMHFSYVPNQRTKSPKEYWWGRYDKSKMAAKMAAEIQK